MTQYSLSMKQVIQYMHFSKKKLDKKTEIDRRKTEVFRFLLFISQSKMPHKAENKIIIRDRLFPTEYSNFGLCTSSVL